jgi:hypothetical protein
VTLGELAHGSPQTPCRPLIIVSTAKGTWWHSKLKLHPSFLVQGVVQKQNVLIGIFVICGRWCAIITIHQPKSVPQDIVRYAVGIMPK